METRGSQKPVTKQAWCCYLERNAKSRQEFTLIFQYFLVLLCLLALNQTKVGLYCLASVLPCIYYTHPYYFPPQKPDSLLQGPGSPGTNISKDQTSLFYVHACTQSNGTQRGFVHASFCSHSWKWISWTFVSCVILLSPQAVHDSCENDEMSSWKWTVFSGHNESAWQLMHKTHKALVFRWMLWIWIWLMSPIRFFSSHKHSTCTLSVLSMKLANHIKPWHYT